MNIYFPDDIPVIALLKFASDHGYALRHTGDNELVFRHSNMHVVPVPGESVRKQHPTFDTDGPGAA